MHRPVDGGAGLRCGVGGDLVPGGDGALRDGAPVRSVLARLATTPAARRRTGILAGLVLAAVRQCLHDGLLKRPRQCLPLGVGVRVSGALHGLGGLGDRHLLPPLDLQQPLVEARGGVDRVADLLGGAPALAGPLLEQAQRIPVPVRQVTQPGFLDGSGERDDLPALGDLHGYARGDDRLGVGDLLVGQLQALDTEGAVAALAAEDGGDLLGDGRRVDARTAGGAGAASGGCAASGRGHGGGGGEEEGGEAEDADGGGYGLQSGMSPRSPGRAGGRVSGRGGCRDVIAVSLGK